MPGDDGTSGAGSSGARRGSGGGGGGVASVVLGTWERGETAYRPDPHLADPALVSKWRIVRTPRSLRMVGTLPVGTMWIIAAVCVALLVGAWTLAATGVISVSTAVFASLVPGLGLVGIGFAAPLMLREARRRRAVVLEHDAITGRLTVHGESVDAHRVEAVERVSFAVEDPSMQQLGRDGRGRAYTSRVHLVLRECLDDASAADPTSGRPGVRYRVIACAGLGLRGHGPRIAERLGVPYETASLGTLADGSSGAATEPPS